jgi:hypothetical protein
VVARRGANTAPAPSPLRCSRHHERVSPKDDGFTSKPKRRGDRARLCTALLAVDDRCSVRARALARASRSLALRRA